MASSSVLPPVFRSALSISLARYLLSIGITGFRFRGEFYHVSASSIYELPSGTIVGCVDYWLTGVCNSAADCVTFLRHPDYNKLPYDEEELKKVQSLFK